MKPYSNLPSPAVPYWRKVLGLAVILGVNVLFIEPAVERFGGQDLVLRIVLRVGMFILITGIVIMLVFRKWGRSSS